MAKKNHADALGVPQPLAVTKAVTKYPIPGRNGTLNVSTPYQVVYCAYDEFGALCLWIEQQSDGVAAQIQYNIVGTGINLDTTKNWVHVQSFIDVAGKVDHIYTRDV